MDEKKVSIIGEEDLTLDVIIDNLKECIGPRMEEGQKIKTVFISLAMGEDDDKMETVCIPMGDPGDLMAFMMFMKESLLSRCIEDCLEAMKEMFLLRLRANFEKVS